MSAATLSETLAHHLCRVQYEAIPAIAIAAAKHSLIDALGVSLAASALGDGCDAFIALALAAGAGVPESTVFGCAAKTSAPMAALANGAMAHALDFEDALDGAPVHPNAVLVAALLAEAEALGGISGREFLTAMALGCDFTCRLALSLRADPAALGWYPPPILGAFGATVAVSRLHRLSPRRLLDALSLTLCQATCAGELKYSAKSQIRAVRDAFPAQAAVQSARLASLGVSGFETPLEGKAGFFALYASGRYDAAVLTHGLGVDYAGARVSIKLWPSCRGTHPFIEAALALRGEVGFASSDVRRIIAHGGPVQRMLMEPIATKLAPQTPINAKFSLPFTLGLALAHGAVTLDSFLPAALEDAPALALARLVEFAGVPDWGEERNASGILELHLVDGRCLKRRVDHPKGHPSNPVTIAELVGKFTDCAARARIPLSAQQAHQRVQAILTLETNADAPRAILGA